MTLFGKDAQTFYSEDPLTASDNVEALSWTLVENIQDENDNFSAEDIDITSRATAKLGWNAVATGPKSGEITFTILMESLAEGSSDPLAAALMASFLAGTTITMAFLTEEGGFGLAANWSVAMTFPKPVKGVQTANVTLKVRSFPEWVSEGITV